MASKGNVVQTVISVLGVIAAFVTTLLTTPLDGSVDTLAVRAIQAVPRFALGVAAGVATIFAAKLMTIVGRKVRLWFRRPATKLKALAPEIKDLHGYDGIKVLAMTKPDILWIHHHIQRCDELRTELSKLGIPVPDRPRNSLLSIPPWRIFLLNLYGCAIRGDVKEARTVLERLEATEWFQKQQGLLERLAADQKPEADGNKAESGAAARGSRRVAQPAPVLRRAVRPPRRCSWCPKHPGPRYGDA